MAANLYNGTYTLTTSEVSVQQVTSAKNLEILLDLTNMSDGDELEATIYEKVLTGGSELLIDTIYLGPVKPAILVVRIGPFCTPYSLNFKLKSIAGATFNVPWVINEL